MQSKLSSPYSQKVHDLQSNFNGIGSEKFNATQWQI